MYSKHLIIWTNLPISTNLGRYWYHPINHINLYSGKYGMLGIFFFFLKACKMIVLKKKNYFFLCGKGGGSLLNRCPLSNWKWLSLMFDFQLSNEMVKIGQFFFMMTYKQIMCGTTSFIVYFLCQTVSKLSLLYGKIVLNWSSPA